MFLVLVTVQPKTLFSHFQLTPQLFYWILLIWQLMNQPLFQQSWWHFQILWKQRKPQTLNGLLRMFPAYFQIQKKLQPELFLQDVPQVRLQVLEWIVPKAVPKALP